MKDFTLSTYKKLLDTLLEKGYVFFTFEEYCSGKASGKFVVIRHDIDNKPANTLKIAEIESVLSLKATYYFRTNARVFDTDIIKKIASSGHEIGYHYRDLTQAGGNCKEAIDLFRQNLSNLRFFVPISTIAMDGNPWSKYDNRDLWKKYDYRNFGIIGEPYFDF
ncbi:MAG: hypothetical protein LBS07_05530, partial [Prevotellaceae bacterium]|nr:hypothetical protein [Prevotellaceae bacterium]